MASVPKGFVLGLCVFAGFVVHGILTRPPAYERAGENQRFNRYTGETEKKVTIIIITPDGRLIPVTI